MRSTLTLRDVTLVLHGEALAPIALSIYKGLADLLGEHGLVRVGIALREGDRDGERSITRMLLTPQDLTLKMVGDDLESVEPLEEMPARMKADFDERGVVYIPDLQDAIDGLEAADA